MQTAAREAGTHPSVPEDRSPGCAGESTWEGVVVGTVHAGFLSTVAMLQIPGDRQDWRAPEGCLEDNLSRRLENVPE